MNKKREALMRYAFSQYGVKEIKGRVDNEKIVKYFAESGHSWVKDDETAWCSAFANWVAKMSDCEMSGKLNARSWMKVGEATDNPMPFDIVVFWREKRVGWKGHVGFYINEDDKYIYVLGGNQNNQVNVTPYPKAQFMGYRNITKNK